MSRNKINCLTRNYTLSLNLSAWLKHQYHERESGYLYRLKFGFIPALLLILTACSNSSPAMVKVSLEPVPYSIEVPAEIAKHLSVENMVTSTSNKFIKQSQEAG
jgi:hypothetical protein